MVREAFVSGPAAIGRMAGRVVAMLSAALVAACGGGGNDDGPTPPVITIQPTNQSVLTGAAGTFSVVATGTAMSYQWMKNGAAIAGATASTYTTSPSTYTDSGTQYTVTVTDANGSVTSSAAQLILALSTNQQAYESLLLSGGSYEFYWNLNYSGFETSGTNYAFSDSAVLAKSPLTNGPQTVTQSAPVNLTTTLALISPGPSRVLKNGVILSVPATQSSSTISYAGSDIQVDTLASDNVTIAYSQIRTGYSALTLAGTLSADASDFAHWHNSFYSNRAILNQTATYAAGAGYLEYTALANGDRYDAFDCHAATLDINISPCLVATSLSAALTTGITSNSDATTYHLSDGVMSTVGGVPVWVASAVRPQSATLSTTVEYRTYFQLNGNVYTGAFIKNGSVLSGAYYVSNPSGATVVDRLTFLPFQIRMNKAARDSVAAAMTI